jgi:hypothetical protein
MPSIRITATVIVSPAIERVIDLALREVPGVAPGILYVERQFGVLEVHSRDLSEVRPAGEAILQGTGAKAADQPRPQVLFHDIIEDITDQHAVILDRNRQASMILPGRALLIYEMTPALFAAVAANEAERAAPALAIVDVQMIGQLAAAASAVAPRTSRRRGTGSPRCWPESRDATTDGELQRSDSRRPRGRRTCARRVRTR